MNTRKYIRGHQIDLIAFDWDGTLMDSTGLIVSSVQLAARDLGLVPPSDERASHIIGLGLIEALRYALPDLDAACYQEVAKRYRHHYLSRDHDLNLFTGVREMVAELADAGYRLGVATGKSRRGLDSALQRSGLDRYFKVTRCADECHSKPHPQMLFELMDDFGIPPEATLMIGDTTHDLLMAKNAGTNGLAVAYGAHPRSDLEAESPIHCASNVEELTAWLKQNS